MTIDHVWLAVPIGLLVCFSFLRQVELVDFWWHLKTGQLILETKSILRTDLFSFTCHGQPFVLQNWLVETLYYSLYRAGGLPPIIALNTGLLVLALVPVFHLCREAAGRTRPAVFAAFLPALMLIRFSAPRTQAFSFALFAIYYWILSGHRDERHNFLWALAPLMLLWVNVHGAFVLGVALTAFFLAGEAIRGLGQDPAVACRSRRKARQLGGVLALAAAATLVNPAGHGIYEAVVGVALDPASQLFVTEWQRPQLDRTGLFVFYTPVFIVLFAMLVSRRRPDLFDLVLFLAFALFAFTAVRNGIWLALIAAPMLAGVLANIPIGRAVARTPLRSGTAPETSSARGSEEGRSRTAPVRHGLNAIIIGFVVFIAALVSPWIRPHLGMEAVGTTLWDPNTPVAAMDYMEERDVRGNVFHPEIYGDYLIWRLWPQQRSFVDSRVHLFGAFPQLVNDYNLVFFDPDWENRLDKYDIRYLLLNRQSDETAGLIRRAYRSERWRLAFEDDLSVLFERSERGDGRNVRSAP